MIRVYIPGCYILPLRDFLAAQSSGKWDYINELHSRWLVSGIRDWLDDRGIECYPVDKREISYLDRQYGCEYYVDFIHDSDALIFKLTFEGCIT